MGRTQDSQFCFNYFYFCLHCVIPWRLLIYTISFKIPVYINLSSQNLHSAIAALKQEAKPLTTLNIEGLRQKIGQKGGNAENKIRMLYTLRQRQVNESNSKRKEKKKADDGIWASADTNESSCKLWMFSFSFKPMGEKKKPNLTVFYNSTDYQV